MAYLLKLKLPSLKVTQTRSHGGVVHTTVPRSCINRGTNTDDDAQASDIHDEQDCAAVDSPPSLEGYSEFDPQETLPSLHEVREKAAVEGWSRVRTALLRTTVECNSMPTGQTCVLCTVEATYRCLDCAPWAYFCAQCFGETHNKLNIFHVGEIWKVCYVRILLM